MAKRSREASFSGRDIGFPPEVANLDRRESCARSLEKFCVTYNPAAFSMPFGSIHRDCMGRIQESVWHGALYAFAMPRGSGKTTICRMGLLWAVSYGYTRYAFLIGATAQKAMENLEAIKNFIRFLPDYVADFPEITHSIRHLGGIAHKASGQHIAGNPTMVQWSKDRIVLPTVFHPDTGEAYPTSGSVIGVSGLTGEGIRGSLFTTARAEQVRPDFVLLDDPQTDESARSTSQNESRLRLITNAVLGMAGPGRTLSAVMPCTRIAPRDMVSEVLDRERNPLWRGSLTKMVPTMPEHMDDWEEYFAIYRDCMSMEPPNQDLANEYYLKHRERLDEGATVTWEDRKGEDDVSAIQHAMHLYAMDKNMFLSEYQNDPRTSEQEMQQVTIEHLEQQQNGLAREVIPYDADVLTAFVDVSEKCLWWMVCAFSRQSFTGSIVASGLFPDQSGKEYVTLQSVRHTLRHKFPGRSYESALRGGLSMLTERLIDREWMTENNVPVRVNLCLIDSGWGAYTDTVYTFCRRSPFANVIMPSKGIGVTAGRNMLVDPSTQRRPGESLLGQWRITLSQKHGTRLVTYDTNHWKTFVNNRLLTGVGSPGALTIHNDEYRRHRMLFEQLTSEYQVRTTGRGRTVDEHHLIPNRDNHLYDAVTGCCVAASILGCSVNEQRRVPKKKKGNGSKKATVTYLQ